MDPAATIRAYYESLRRGDPLTPYFVTDSNAVKIGISEHLTGYEEIAEGLRTQTETTTDWHVESHTLTVGERATCAWFADDVTMAWTDPTDERRTYDTRWSGTLCRRDEHDIDTRSEEDGETDEFGAERDPDSRTNGGEWCFVSMHVSCPTTIDRSESP